ncbi:hypothetical protein CCP3SC15_2050006 [Gammaproteobacteria bacterium]
MPSLDWDGSLWDSVRLLAVCDVWLEYLEENMDYLGDVLKSRRASIAKLRDAVASLERLAASTQIGAQRVLTAEVEVRKARLLRLEAEALALQSEVERMNPVLPGTEAKPKK